MLKIKLNKIDQQDNIILHMNFYKKMVMIINQYYIDNYIVILNIYLQVNFRMK